MKTLFSKKHIAILAFFALSIIAILNSCKKESSIVTTRTMEKETEAVMSATKARYGSVSSDIIYPVNKVAGRLDYDANGNEIIVQGRSAESARVLCTGYTCADAVALGLTRGDIDEVYTLTSAEIYAGCGTQNGTEVRVTWNLSVPYTVLKQNSPTLPSKGRIRFVSSTGTVLYSNINITPIAIVSLGTDPTCSNNKLFTVTYKLANVPDSYLSSGNKLECGLFIYTDCTSLAPNYVTQWTQATVFQSSNTYALPCSRIDKLWINPSTGTALSQCATVAGAYVTCPAPPANFVRTTSQQVEYRKRNTASYVWTAQTSTVYNGENSFTVPVSYPPILNASTGFLYLREMRQGQSATGWLVRYRNVYSTTCTVITPINSTWVAGTYATEYWPY